MWHAAYYARLAMSYLMTVLSLLTVLIAYQSASRYPGESRQCGPPAHLARLAASFSPALHFPLFIYLLQYPPYTTLPGLRYGAYPRTTRRLCVRMEVRQKRQCIGPVTRAVSSPRAAASHNPTVQSSPPPSSCPGITQLA